MDKSLKDFLKNGGKIIQCTTRKPRKEEITWPASRYSIYNIGAQGVSFGRGGVSMSRDQIK